jgi:hypothetical protein
LDLIEVQDNGSGISPHSYESVGMLSPMSFSLKTLHIDHSYLL